MLTPHSHAGVVSRDYLYSPDSPIPTPHSHKVFLVSMARWNHTDPFPNSEVKRCCGDDSLGVALRQNSSMPGFIFTNPLI